MSRIPESLAQRSPFGWDSLDDPLNDAWDAIVRHDGITSSDTVTDDVAVLRRAYALEAKALPSPTFFGDLEQRLREVYSLPVTIPERESQQENQKIATVPPAPKRKAVLPRTPRMVFMPAAFAVIALVLVTSLVVLYLAVPGTSEPPAIPAARVPDPTLQTLVQFDFSPPMLGLPDVSTWSHMDFSLLQLGPGKSFTTDIEWYTAFDAPLIFTVLSGELTMHPTGPALFFAAHQAGQPPLEIPAGQAVSLGPDDTLVYSSQDTATGNNPGSESVLTLLGSAGHMIYSPDASPIDITKVDFTSDDELQVLPAQGASISIQRLTLEPFDSFVFDPDDALRYLVVLDQFQMDGMRIAPGALETLAPDVETDRLSHSTQLIYKDSGPHTLFHLGEETVDIYFLTVEPLSDSGTPAA